MQVFYTAERRRGERYIVAGPFRSRRAARASRRDRKSHRPAWTVWTIKEVG